MERKPGRPRALTIESIAQAALDDGIDTFSMPSVARRLGVAHSGLYRYVTDREDLLVRAIDRAFMATELPSHDLSWEELMREIGETVWSVCDAHPGLARAAQLAPRPAPSLLTAMQSWVASIQSQGFLPEDAAVAVEFVLALATDCSMQMARLRAIRRTNPDLQGVLIKPYDSDEVWTGRGLYARKLDIFVAGLALRRIEG